ncbi:DUF2255 family protein [Agrobacterium rhizogenes]|nr:DUF2255 family protein [Rhizobium rhizogenes]NTJ80953.1 DUF2255 family protein [Rhizobium rhizogenes]
MDWNPQELAAIATADDLHIAPFRDDGITYGTLTWIWSVVVDGVLYVRAYNGKGSRWYGAAMKQHTGRITAAGLDRDVSFDPVDGPLNAAIDDAYRAKYAGSRYLAAMIGDRARGATVRITPRNQ